MKFFVDTANIDDIKELNDYGLLDGVTTNPSLIAKSGRDFKEVIAEICKVVEGPVSAEVAAMDFDGMVAEGEHLAKIADNVVIKLPLTLDGLKACRHFSGKGIKTNVTLCFAANQALLAAKGGATFISPFIGRLDDINLDGMDLIAEIRQIYDNYGYETEILAASIRTVNHVKEAALVGADVGTMPPGVLKLLAQHPLTDKGLDAKKLEKIWTDWEAFASYAFNKSHSTCYAFVAYQTAFLKAHYKAEYMSAVLTSSLGNIEKITFFLEECKSIGIPVLGPDINESDRQFNPNKRGEIRFGLGAIKGTGDAAVESIISERDQNGPFTDIFDFIIRVNLRTVNKKTLESLAFAGAFDCFETIHRAQYFETEDADTINFIEKLIKFANAYHAEKASSQSSLFGAFGGNDVLMAKPKVPDVEAWGDLQKLRHEQDVVGFYISGHPLDTFRLEMDNFCTCTLEKVLEIPEEGNQPIYLGKEITVAGIVTSVQERMSKRGSPFIIFKMEDYRGSLEMLLGGDDMIRMKNYLQVGSFLYLKGKVQSRYYNEDQFEFKVLNIQLLTEIREKMCKEVKMKCAIEIIDQEFVSVLQEALVGHPGNCAISLSVVDNESKIEVQLLSRMYRVDPSNELFNRLKLLKGVEFSLN